MNAQIKKRLLISTIAIVVIVVAVVFFVGGGSSAKSVTIKEATSGNMTGQKIQVSGNVVDNSYAMEGSTLVFSIYDAEDISAGQLKVCYQGAVSSTFGNGVTAICTGKIDSDGVLQATELVTKCPSKYENSSNALSVSKVLSYGDSVYNKPVKVVGLVSDEGIATNGTTKTFVLCDAEDKSIMLKVTFEGALAEGINAGKSVVLTGSLTEDGSFNATEVSLEA